MTVQRLSLILITSIFMLACGSKTEKGFSIKEGIWSATLSLQNVEVPFLIEILDQEHAEIINGEERIPVDMKVAGDSIKIAMHIFDATIEAKVENEKLEGAWIKHYVEDYVVPFHAAWGKQGYFEEKERNPTQDVSGKWAVNFEVNTGRRYNAIGVFSQNGSDLSGSFLTATGDYRFLNGFVDGNTLSLSAFNGEQAYLFEGTVEGDSIIDGKFWSGKTFFASWNAVKNPGATLPDPETLTYLKEGYDKISFAFPDLNGDTVTLSDPRYQNKVVILQIFGTWCPNCMDETVFLSDWYRQNQDKGVAIIGLAYEKKADFEYARKRVETMVKRLDVPYDFLIAGSTEKGSAEKSLPMLNHVMSYPTTIFIDRKGEVRKIHTGFSGPGTGEYFSEYVEEFNLFMDKLLAE